MLHRWHHVAGIELFYSYVAHMQSQSHCIANQNIVNQQHHMHTQPHYSILQINQNSIYLQKILFHFAFRGEIFT